MGKQGSRRSNSHGSRGHLDFDPERRLTSAVRFYGLVDVEDEEAIELYARQDEAERALAEILGDEPEWEGRFVVRLVELVTGSLN